MKKNSKISELIGLALMLPSVALAQASGSQGGGEDGVFKGIRDEVGGWMVKNIAINKLEEKLELKTMSGVALQASFNQAVADVGEKVVFTTNEIKIGDNSRICKNENKTITCNVDAWNNTRGDTRYMIVFHEYLGVAGIETNVEVDYSRYPISSKILGYVYTKESFELGMEKAITPLNYNDVKLDFSAIFNEKNQQMMTEHLKENYNIPFQFLSQPFLKSTSDDLQKRTYNITVLRKSQNTGESTAYLSCSIDVTLQFYSPREQWQKQMQDYQKQVELQRKAQENAQIAEQLLHQQNIQLTQLQKQEVIRNEQLTSQQQSQQPQQQQAQAPIPAVASSVVNISSQCELKKGKGFFLTDEEFSKTSLFQYAKKHNMLMLSY